MHAESSAQETRTGGGGGTDADVVVIGAGIAGLTAACALAEAGLRCIILETGPVAGGCMRLHEVGGIQVDRGADSYALSRPAIGALAEHLRLEIAQPLAAPAWVQFASKATRGRTANAVAGAAPLPANTLLGIPADPTAADVRRVIGTAGSLRARLDRALPRSIFGQAGEGARGFGALVCRRMGRRVLHRLVEPIVAGVYSTDPADLDVDTIAPTLRAKLTAGQSLSDAVRSIRSGAPAAGSAVGGIRGGMGMLSAALITALHAAGGQLRLESPATSINRSGPLWQVAVGNGGARLAAPNVVIAGEAPSAAALVAQATRGALALPTAPATPVAIVTLVVDQPALDSHPRGTGVLVSPRAGGITAKALTHLTAKWSYVAEQADQGRHVLRLSYGRGARAEPRTARPAAAEPAATEPGGAVPTTAGLPPDGAFPRLALRDAAALLGVPLAAERLVDVAVVRFDNQLTARRVGQSAAIEKFRAELAEFPGLGVVGASVSGTGVTGIVTDATRWALAMASQWGSTMGS